MQEQRVSALTVCEREFIIEAGGKDRREAFAQAFSALKAREPATIQVVVGPTAANANVAAANAYRLHKTGPQTLILKP